MIDIGNPLKNENWSKIEDEILKAAISKYGIHQWSRVASLLPKKTAKQVKNRWDKWINPQIKKGKWTKEEDEKLLELIRSMPNQWTTIGPILGRTGQQILERYQNLIEEHLGEKKTVEKDVEEVEETEEDREMIQEARSRLLNTQGKKAKRKARERMLKESRRIAIIQKRRELKRLGISVSLGERKDKDNEIEMVETQEGYFEVENEKRTNLNEQKIFENEKSIKHTIKHGIRQEKLWETRKVRLVSDDLKKEEEKIFEDIDFLSNVERPTILLPKPLNAAIVPRNFLFSKSNKTYERSIELLKSVFHDDENKGVFNEINSDETDNLLVSKLIKNSLSKISSPVNNKKIKINSIGSDITKKNTKKTKFSSPTQINSNNYTQVNDTETDLFKELDLPFLKIEHNEDINLSDLEELDKLIFLEYVSLISSDKKKSNKKKQTRFVSEIQSKIAKLTAIEPPYVEITKDDFFFSKDLDNGIKNMQSEIVTFCNETQDLKNKLFVSLDFHLYLDKEKQLFQKIENSFLELNRLNMDFTLLNLMLKNRDTYFENELNDLSSDLNKVIIIESSAYEKLSFLSQNA